MGKYTKQKSGLYRTYVNTGEYDENGKPIRISLSGHTIKELEEKIAKTKEDIKDRMNIAEEDMPFGKYAKKWFDTYKKPSRSNRTVIMYDDIVTRILSSLYNIPLNKLTRSDIQGVINSNSAHPRTCEQALMTIKQICKSAVHDGLIRKSPVIDIDLPRHVKNEKRALTADEKKAVKAAELDDRERAYISLLLGTGMRPAEVMALTWGDIDFKRKEIKVTKSLTFLKNGEPEVVYPKTNSGIRTIQAPDFVFNALLSYQGKTDSLIVFNGKKGGNIARTTSKRTWARIKRKIEKALGYETDLTEYCFRHNYCSELYYSGISLLEAKRLMGHSSLDMVMKIYTHLDAQKEDTAAKLNAINF